MATPPAERQPGEQGQEQGHEEEQQQDVKPDIKPDTTHLTLTVANQVVVCSGFAPSALPNLLPWPSARCLIECQKA